MWVLMFVVAFIFIVFFTPIGMVFTIVMALIEWNYDVFNIYYKNLSISLDQFGNVALAGLFNLLLISAPYHLFGDPDETISSVLGKNKLKGTLTYLGKRLDALLNGLDKNHSIKSIEK